MRAFAQAERFVSELESRKLRPAYVFVGDEAFFPANAFRDAILEHLVPVDLRDFSLFEFDLGENDLAEVLDRARTPSLMAPFQVFFVRGVKSLFWPPDRMKKSWLRSKSIARTRILTR